MSARIHPTAMVEPGVILGERTAIWDNVHIRAPARVGDDCIIGEKTYVAYGVEIGDRTKVNAFVYICTGVRIGTGVMISAGTVFTNDRFPRATTPGLDKLRTSEPDEHTLQTVVGDGATLGARSVIGPGLSIGRWAMVGMGALVTRTVGDFHLVIGSPARAVAAVCRCGTPVMRLGRDPVASPTPVGTHIADCPSCERRYEWRDGVVVELGSEALTATSRREWAIA